MSQSSTRINEFRIFLGNFKKFIDIHENIFEFPKKKILENISYKN